MFKLSNVESELTFDFLAKFFFGKNQQNIGVVVRRKKIIEIFDRFKKSDEFLIETNPKKMKLISWQNRSNYFNVRFGRKVRNDETNIFSAETFHVVLQQISNRHSSSFSFQNLNLSRRLFKRTKRKTNRAFLSSIYVLLFRFRFAQLITNQSISIRFAR